MQQQDNRMAIYIYGSATPGAVANINTSLPSC